jgi:hypothetical protein
MSSLTTLVIGIFIGWNLPQPPWAREVQDTAAKIFRSTIKSVARRL